MAPPFLAAGGASHWPSKSHPEHCSSPKQLERCHGETRRSKAQRSAQQPAKNRPVFCVLRCSPLPVCRPPPPAEDQERSTGPQHRTVPHGPARPVLAWLPGCLRLLGWPAKTRISLLALLSPHFFFFFFRLLLPSSFDVDAVILLSSPSSYLLSTPQTTASLFQRAFVT